ncbi:hypothetical protein TSUD_198570 [Trifolium subterraneum]|uniref:Uncharacterized protein n=1 Tax=Trifolium subterraneum TaxID=3900 RepID=A0A2Z6LR32_TRISU|nr:hypothetical protein TSUD_198570 [Trifolium subterraneum]
MTTSSFTGWCSPGWIPRQSSLPLRVFSILGKVIRYTTVMVRMHLSLLKLCERTSDSARFDSLTTSELRNLALSYEVKGTVLTHLLSARRDKEILEANSKVTRAEQVVTDAERTVTEIKKQWTDEVDRLKKTHKEALAEMRGAHGREIAELRKKHTDEKASLRTKAAILEAEVTTLEVLRNNLIVSLTQSWKDISELEEDVDELEETNTALKQSMADKYVDGFWSSIEQVRILFPELDPDVLAQVDVMKRIKDDKLI